MTSSPQLLVRTMIDPVLFDIYVSIHDLVSKWCCVFLNVHGSPSPSISRMGPFNGLGGFAHFVGQCMVIITMFGGFCVVSSDGSGGVE